MRHSELKCGPTTCVGPHFTVPCSHGRTDGICSALDVLGLALPKRMCAQGFAYHRIIWLDEVLLEAPKQQRLGAMAVHHDIRSGGSSTSLMVIHVDEKDRRDVDSSQGTAASAAVRAWRHGQIGATALISRPAARLVSFSVPAMNATRLFRNL